MELQGNKYNAKTETQLKFAERIEKDLGLVCDFSKYFITRGRGWSVIDGSCSSSVAVKPNKRSPYGCYLALFHPLREYLSKKKYLSAYEDRNDIFVEIEDKPAQGGWR